MGSHFDDLHRQIGARASSSQVKKSISLNHNSRDKNLYPTKMAREASTFELQATQISTEGVLIFNDQGKILLSNPVSARMFGYQANEMAGMSVHKLVPGIRAIAKQEHENLSSSMGKAKLKSIGKDGIEFKSEISLSQFQSGSEVLTIAFIAEAEAKKKTEEQVRALAIVETINLDLQLQIQKRRSIEKKMMKLQRLYDTMVHNFPEGVIGVLDRNMKYVLIDGKDLNEIDLPALGLAGEQVTEKHDPVLAEETLSKIKKAFDGQSISFEVKTSDRCYHIAAVPLPDAQNNINEILCVLKNITEKNRLEDGLLKALEKEKELGEFKSRFVTMACHEFKTPLATILSSIFLLENYTGKDYEKEKIVHTNRIKRSVNNLTMILNEFLSLEKLEGNQVKVINTDISLPRYIAELICEVEGIKQKGQVIEYEHLGDQEKACLDPHLLWSIITNLISNALKYSKEGDNVFLTSEIKNNKVTITVKDFGMGIPEEEHKHIFGRFNRARNALNFEGTGLGLHIVEKNVKLFNGSVTFTSQLNGGTEFTVVLPNGEC